MTLALQRAFAIVESFDRMKSAAAAGRAFFDALAPLGARGFGARAYFVTGGSQSDAPQGGAFAQILPPHWRGSASGAYIESLDPLPKAARRFRRPAFLWSDASPRRDAVWREYWEALSEHGLEDGTAVHFFTPGGLTSRVSVGFGRSLEVHERKAVELASYALIDRLHHLSPPHAPLPSTLSDRERDCLALVAEGKSDAEIGEKLGITRTTAHFYIEKAKRKLGARTRAQAVARLITLSLI